MFDSLTDRFEGILSRLRSRGRLSPDDVDEVLREIRTALLEADVELGEVRGFTQTVRARSVGLELPQSLSPGQQVIKIVNEELTAILGGETLKISYASKPPTVVLLAGLQGSGKTTTAAKLARWFKQQGRNPLLVGADLQRPAAVEQLRVLGGRAGISVFSESTDPVAVATATGSVDSLNTEIPARPPSTRSCSTAAGRCRSAPTSKGLRPCCLNHRASLAAVVVFPEPWRPAKRTTVGGLLA